MADNEHDQIAEMIGMIPSEDRRNALNHFAAIGVVASNWAGFEMMIDLLSIRLAEIPQEVGLCFTSQVSGHARKLDAYIAIARLRGADKFMGRLDHFAKDTMALAERRNRVVHDPWLVLYGPGGSTSRLEVTARRKLKHQYVEMSKEEILNLAQEIDAHQGKFTSLHEEITAVIGTSPGTRRR